MKSILYYRLTHRLLFMLFLRLIKLADSNACDSDETKTVTEEHEGKDTVFTFIGNNENWVDGGLEYLDCIEAGM